jgi:hypothetical protein
VIDNFHAQSIVSHDLTGCQLKLRLTVNFFQLSSFREATVSSHIISLLSLILIFAHQKIFISYLSTVISGALFMFNVRLAFLVFPAASVTFIVKVHSSLMVVHEVTGFQLIDNSTLQFLVVSSDREAISVLQI